MRRWRAGRLGKAGRGVKTGSRRKSIDPGGILDVQLGLGMAAPVVDLGAPGEPEAAVAGPVQQGLAHVALRRAKGDRLEPGAVLAADDQPDMVAADDVYLDEA